MARKQNLNTNDGVAWYTRYGISAGVDDMEVVVFGGNGKERAVGFYGGSGALTLSNYNGFPVGSVILDFQAFKTHYKTASTTWKSSAAAT